ncbi:hypothetical protein MPH_04733, partial [Macrophomina phaseolina MS6]
CSSVIRIRHSLYPPSVVPILFHRELLHTEASDLTFPSFVILSHSSDVVLYSASLESYFITPSIFKTHTNTLHAVKWRKNDPRTIRMKLPCEFSVARSGRLLSHQKIHQ